MTAVLVGLPAVVAAGGSAASMDISVTVVRSCSVDTGRVLSSGAVVLTCSAGASPTVRVGSTPVTSLMPGTNRVAAEARDGALTINF